MNYVKLHTDALLAYKRLTDTEFGRAVRAILQYAEDGTEANLPGKESIMYDVLREQVERDRKSYDKKVKALSENGSKGGRPRKDGKPNKSKCFLENQTKANESKKSQEKEKEKEYITPLPPFGGEDGEDKLMLIAQANQAVYDRAQECGFAVNTATLDRLTSLISDYGTGAVLSALDECVEHGAKSLAYLRKVLENRAPQKDTKSQENWADQYAYL